MDRSVPRKGRRPVRLRVFALALNVIVLAGCESIDTGAASRAAMNEAIRKEPAGNYFIGRRMYKVDYKVWGWVREPGKPWNTAKLVMLNEQRMLAPDRARNKLGSDNNYEYRLTGYFSGETVYEPASNGFYPGVHLPWRRGEINQSSEHLPAGAAEICKRPVSFSLRPSVREVRQVVESADDTALTQKREGSAIFARTGASRPAKALLLSFDSPWSARAGLRANEPDCFHPPTIQDLR